MAKDLAKKGCINETCIARKKKIAFKSDDLFCPKCGKPLEYVCSKCWKKLADGSQKYCIRCQSDIQDKKDKWAETFQHYVVDKVVDLGDAVADVGKQAGAFIQEGAGEVQKKAAEVIDGLKKDKQEKDIEQISDEDNNEDNKE